jgi:putative transposase
MSRLRRLALQDRIFFITTNLTKQSGQLSPPERDLLLNTLAIVRNSRDFLILGYAVMPEHVHLLLAVRTADLSELMHQWKFRSGYAIQKSRGQHGRLWQPRYFDFICRRSRDVSDKLQYIHRNPVEAGLVRQPTEWPRSSAAHYAGTSPSPITPDHLDFSGDPNELLWPAPNRPP